MGTIHGQLTEMTLTELAEKSGKKYDTLYRKFRRTFPDATWTADTEVPADVAAEILGKKKPAIRRKDISKPSTPREVKQPPVQGPAVASRISNFEFDAINFIEMGLILYGLILLYGVAGGLLGIMCCLFIYKSQSIAKDKDLRETNYKSIEVIWWVSFASFFLHSITFYNSIQIQHTGVSMMLMVHLVAAAAPALFVSVLSFKAVATTKVISEEKA